MLLTDVITNLWKKYGSNFSWAILMRHFDYLIKNVQKEYPEKSILWILAMHYANLIPGWKFPLSQKGKDQGWITGNIFKAHKEFGFDINNFRCSSLLRGIESIQSIAETYSKEGAVIEIDNRLTSAPYDFKIAVELMEEKFLVNKWFNGYYPGLVHGTEKDPKVYKKNRLSLIKEFLSPGNFSLCISHLPEIIFFDQIFVQKRELGNFEEDYEPPKGGGVLITSEKNGIVGDSFRFNEDLIIC